MQTTYKLTISSSLNVRQHIASARYTSYSLDRPNRANLTHTHTYIYMQIHGRDIYIYIDIYI